MPGDAGVLQTVPEHGTKPNHSTEKTQGCVGGSWRGCLTSSELFPNRVAPCIIYRLSLCPCGSSLISRRFGKAEGAPARPR